MDRVPSDPTVVPPSPSDTGATQVSASSPAPGAAPAVPKRLGKFLLLDELGSGGMGTVYRARQEDLDRIVALKVLHGGAAAGALLVERFQREARAAARLDDPGIVRVYEVGEDNGIQYFSMEYVEGEDLLDRIRRDPPGLQERVRWIRDASWAVEHAHQNGLVHRDLKPHNILLCASGVVKVADFGLARDITADSRLTLSGEILGTPHYMSPEQARGDWARVGPRSDVYSLGATLYEVVSGSPPVDLPNMYDVLDRIVKGEIPPLRTRMPKAPRDLETVCMKAMDPDPARRYATAGELGQDLDRLLRLEAVLARPLGWWEGGLRRLRRHWRGVAALTLLVALAGAGVAAVLQKRGEYAARQEAEALYQRAIDPVYVLDHGGVAGQMSLLGDAAARCPGFAPAHFRLGLLQEWTGKKDLAEKAYREAVACDPGLAAAWSHLATLCFVRGYDGEKKYWDLGRTALAELEQRAPGSPTARFTRVFLDSVSLQEPRPPEATLAMLEEIAPAVPEARLLMAGIHGFCFHPVRTLGFPWAGRIRDLGVAHEQFEAVVRADPLHILARMNLALVRYELGDLAGAESDLRFVAKMAPDWDQPHYLLGRVLFAQRRLPEAERALNRCIQLEAAEAHLRFLAMVLAFRRDYPGALEALDRIPGGESRSGDTHAIRAMALFGLGRVPEAGKEMDLLLADNAGYFREAQELASLAERPEVQAGIALVQNQLIEFQDVLFLAPASKKAVKAFLPVVAGIPKLQDMLERYQATRLNRHEKDEMLLDLPRYERELPEMTEFLRWFGKRIGVAKDVPQLMTLLPFWIRLGRDLELQRRRRLVTAEEYVWRAGIRYRTDQIAEALSDLESAERLTGADPRVHWGQATLHALRGDARRCADAVRKARLYGWKNLEWAADDPDFEKVLDNPDVRSALEMTESEDRSNRIR